jgi:hypothetical protein
MLRDLRGRQREAMARAKELRQQRKKQRVERAAVEAETKRREQRNEQRLAASVGEQEKATGAAPSRSRESRRNA